MAKRQKTRPAKGKGQATKRPIVLSKGPSAPQPLEPWQEAGLTAAQYTFCLAYLENGFNSRAAYLTAHPGVTIGTAGTEGHRTLNNPKVRAFLNGLLEAAWQPLILGGEQALARVSMAATLDAADLFDENDQLLPVRSWPLNARVALRSVQEGPYGRKVTFVDPHAALRTILEQTGKLKTPGDGLDALAEALKADLERTRPLARPGDPE